MCVCKLYLCVYYYRMIKLHHGHPWKTKWKTTWEAHIYLLNTGETTAWIRENPQQENNERNHYLWDNNPTKTCKHYINTREKEGK